MISTTSFYNGRKSRRDETREEKYHNAEKKLKLAYPPDKPNTSLFGPSPILKVFKKLTDALHFSQRKSQLELVVFAKEVGVGGERLFIASDREQFWTYYQTIPLHQRHFYEIIKKSEPCKLYFDLEFMKKRNEDRDGESMTRVLILKVIEKVWSEFGIRCIFEDVLILDSTTDKKFSIHLVFNNKCLVFANNQHAGCFVTKFIRDLKIEDRIEFEAFSDSGKKLFVDCGVYTKNRNFRIFLSTKFGQQRNLRISSMDLFSVCFAENNPNVNKNQFEKEIFMSSLITKIDEDSNSKTILCCSKDKFPNAKPILPTHTNTISSGKSPFVEVDIFVQNLVLPGFIRKWRYLPDSSSIIYEIGGTRFCGNAGRDHKSNNIFFLADLRQGAVFQKCHDPDCSGYKSHPILLSESTLPWMLMDEWNGDKSVNTDQFNTDKIDDVDLVAAENKSETHDVLNDNSDEILLEIIEDYEKQEKLLTNSTGSIIT